MDYTGGDGGDNLYNISVHKVADVNPTISTCTWNTPWTTPGAQDDIVATAEDTKSIDKAYLYNSWSVTSMVQDWVTNQSSNYGMLLKSDTTASSDSNRYFASTENLNTAQRPKLIVSYSVGGSSCGNADSDEDSIVSITELIDYISQWKAGSVTISQLITGIGEWKNGCS